MEGHRFAASEILGQTRAARACISISRSECRAVAERECTNARRGQNYHQWLSAQYGLKKLVEHMWMLIGVARTCETMTELRDGMAALNGKHPVQLRLYLPTPGAETPAPMKRRLDDRRD